MTEHFRFRFDRRNEFSSFFTFLFRFASRTATKWRHGLYHVGHNAVEASKCKWSAYALGLEVTLVRPTLGLPKYLTDQATLHCTNGK